MKVPVTATNGKIIGALDVEDSVAAEIANVAIHGGGRLVASPQVLGERLAGITLAFEVQKKQERPRLVGCPPGCEEAAMKLLSECEVPQ